MAWTHFTAPLAAATLPTQAQIDELYDGFDERLQAIPGSTVFTLDSADIRASQIVTDKISWNEGATRKALRFRDLITRLADFYIPSDDPVDYLVSIWPSGDLFDAAWAALGGSGSPPARVDLATTVEFNLAWASLNLLTMLRFPISSGDSKSKTPYLGSGFATFADAVSDLQGAAEDDVTVSANPFVRCSSQCAPADFNFTDAYRTPWSISVPATAPYSSGATWRAWIVGYQGLAFADIESPVEFRIGGSPLSGTCPPSSDMSTHELTGTLTTTATGTASAEFVILATESGGDASLFNITDGSDHHAAAYLGVFPDTADQAVAVSPTFQKI